MISGLGADDLVLSKLVFPEGIEPVFIPWLIPNKDESLDNYVDRMSEGIDTSSPFALFGYSFGGVIVQEIHRKKEAAKIVILGSIKNESECSNFIKLGGWLQFPKRMPLSVFNEKSTVVYTVLRKIFDPRNPKLMQYFRMKDPYYLKWSMDKMVNWKSHPLNIPVIQVMGTKDIVFPIKKCHPDFTIEGGSHLFPVTKSKEVSKVLSKIFS